MPARHVRALVALTALAAALRFSTLDVQSFWFDEAVTADLLRRGVFDMLGEIPGSESTPPLYYVVAWLWSKLFGTGEIGLRSLSALLGTAMVPVAYAAAAAAVSRRAALFTAALVAVNPLLVWYSQEARAYALLALLSALSLWLFFRARRDPAPRTLAGWAAVSALALATHYFAIFLVAAEAALLLRLAPDRRRVAPALGAVGAAALALAPLAIHQASNDRAGFIEDSSLLARVAQVPKQFLIAYDAPAEAAVTFVAALLALAGLWLLATRASDGERRRSFVPAVLAAVAAGVPVLIAVGGPDYVISRNLLPALLPAAIVVGAGYATGRAGLGAAVALCAVSVAVVVSVAAEPEFQRDDWRGAAEALGPAAPGTRALVVTPGSGRVPLRLYLPAASTLPRGGAEVSEVVMLGLPERRAGQDREPPEPRPQQPLEQEGFRLVERERTDAYTLLRFTSTRGRTRVEAAQLAFNRLSDVPAAVLLQP